MTAGPLLDDVWDDWKPTEQTALDFLLEPWRKSVTSIPAQWIVTSIHQLIAQCWRKAVDQVVPL